jgi:DNA/RNA-binding domain of Phe-tRNA-synthetase-like protein
MRLEQLEAQLVELQGGDPDRHQTMSSLPVQVTDTWREAFPDARVGLLLVDGVSNPATQAGLEARAREVEARLRERFNGADRAALLALPTMQPYLRHYRAFGQTYHVLRQLESVALKGTPLRSPSALVLAMYAVELETLLLTAGHDADALRPPLVLDRSTAGDAFTGINGREHALRDGDMLVRDADGIISAVIYGPDQRTRLNPNTTRVLFTTYAPGGIDADTLDRHLAMLSDTVRLIAPAAAIRLQAVYP